MSVSNTSGKTYDVAEYGRLEDTFNQLNLDLEKIDREKSVEDKKILQYVIVLTGFVFTLYLFNRLVNKKK